MSFVLCPLSFDPQQGQRTKDKGQRTNPMTTDEVLFDMEERMEKAVTVYRDELRGLRTGRATPALLDALRVEYYGSPTPIKQIAQVSTPDPQQLVIRPLAANALKDIEKAIRASNLGLAPDNDGKNSRLQALKPAGDVEQKILLLVKRR